MSKYIEGDRVFYRGELEEIESVQISKSTKEVKYQLVGCGLTLIPEDLLERYYVTPRTPPVPPPTLPPMPVAYNTPEHPPQPPEPVKALRYNAGKPQLSYLLDFSKSLKLITHRPMVVHEIDEKWDSFNEFLMTFIETGDYSHIVECVHQTLFILEMVTHEAPRQQQHGYVGDIDDLFELYPNAFEELVRVCSNGALKYDRNNWKNGLDQYEILDCAMRHHLKFHLGEERDVVDDSTLSRVDLIEHFNGDMQEFKDQFATHHLAHVLWNLLVILEQKPDD